MGTSKEYGIGDRPGSGALVRGEGGARRRSLRFVWLLLLTGCIMGGTVESFAPARTTAGLDVTLQLGARTVAGELLAVEDTALLLVVRFPNPDSSSMPRLARVQTRRIRGIEGSVSLRGRWATADREKFRGLARYPQGINSELEARLVAAYRVASVGWVPE